MSARSPIAACLTVLVLVIPLAPSLHAQEAARGGDRFAGDWSGTLDVGAVQLRLVLHVTGGEDGAYAATLDSPDQGAFGIPASGVEVAGDSLTVEFAQLTGRYAGVLAAEGAGLTGTWSQAGQSFSLDLERGALDAARRPQHPEPPYPYDTEDVSFAGGAAGVELAGTLTLPEGAGPHPAAVLVSGSGPQDRNEEIFQHKPFLVLADYLTRRGIAVLRYDDRGVAGSTGDFAAATSEDFADDAAAAVAYLRSREEVDLAAIGVIGHSEGGLVAQLLATRADVPVAYVVTIGGPGLPGDSVLALQVDALNKAAGMTEGRRAAANALQRRLMDVAISDVPADSAREDIVAIFESETPGVPAAQIRHQAEAITSPWMRWFLRHDPRPVLRELTIPLLAVNGARDLQVLAGPNLEAMASALEAAGNEDFTVVELQGLNHLLQTSESGQVAEYGRIEETIAPIALRTIGDWIVERTGGD